MAKKKKALLRDSLNSKNLIIESVDRTEETQSLARPILGSYYIKGMTAENTLNQNGRKYGEAVWQQPNSFLPGGKFINENGELNPLTLWGGLDHVIDDSQDFRLENAAICWYEVKRNDDGTWDGGYDVLDTPQGKVVHTISEYALAKKSSGLVGVSSRAFGDAVFEETAEGSYESIVPEGFELISWDFVYNPSFTSAKVAVNESRTSLTESIKKLAEDDPEHKDYYESVVDTLAESKEGEEVMEKTKTLRQLLSESIHLTVDEIKELEGDLGALTQVEQQLSGAKTELENLELLPEEEVAVEVEAELERITELHQVALDLLMPVETDPIEESTLNESEEDNNEEESEEDNNEEESEADEEETNEEEKEEETSAEVTIESLSLELAEIKAMVADILFMFQPVEAFDTPTEDETNEEESGEEETNEEDGELSLDDLTEEDLELLTDEELEELLALN